MEDMEAVGTVWLHDHATNSTYVNATKIGKGKKRVISDGDEIVLVQSDEKDRRTGKARFTISYKFNVVNATEYLGQDYIKNKYQYDATKPVAEGGTRARCYKCVEKETGITWALKATNKEVYNNHTAATGGNCLVDLTRESQITAKFKHDNIVFLKEYYDDGTEFFMVYEWLPFGGLGDFVFERSKGQNRVKEADIKTIFLQLLDAIVCIHREKILHRDLKPDNILVKSIDPLQIKVIDFGFAADLSQYPHNMVPAGSKKVGSPLFTSPEIDAEKQYGYKSDYWALGCILWILITGDCPYREDFTTNAQKHLKLPLTEQKLVALRFTKKNAGHVSGLCRDLIVKLTKPDQKERFNAEMLQRHPWINASGILQRAAKRR
eukprot:UN23546